LNSQGSTLKISTCTYTL